MHRLCLSSVLLLMCWLYCAVSAAAAAVYWCSAVSTVMCLLLLLPLCLLMCCLYCHVFAAAPAAAATVSADVPLPLLCWRAASAVLCLLPLLLYLLVLLCVRLHPLSSSFTRIKQDDDKGKDSSGYGSRDSIVSSGRDNKDEAGVAAYRRTRSDLSAELLSRANSSSYGDSGSSSNNTNGNSTTHRSSTLEKSSWTSPKWVPFLPIYSSGSLVVVVVVVVGVRCVRVHTLVYLFPSLVLVPTYIHHLSIQRALVLTLFTMVVYRAT